MNSIYEKDIVWDKKNEHYVHIDPSITSLMKIISIEGPQRILLYKDIMFNCAKAYDNTHYDMYNTLYDNNYLTDIDRNNFGFLIETKLFFGGSIIFNKDRDFIDSYEELPLYCKNFNLIIINGNYTSIDQVLEFYNLLPNNLKIILGELDIEKCNKCLKTYKAKENDSTELFDSFIEKNKEENVYLKQLSRYINELDKLVSQDSVNINQIKYYIKLSKKAYMDYKSNY